MIITSQVDIPGGGYVEFLQAGVVSGSGDRTDLPEVTEADSTISCSTPTAC